VLTNKASDVNFRGRNNTRRPILVMLVSDGVGLQYSATEIKALIQCKSEYVTQDAMAKCVCIYTEIILVI